MKPLAWNVWTCEKCRRQLVTVDLVDGVTPYLMRCDPDRTLGGCGAFMRSACYPETPRPAGLVPTHEWYRPNALELADEMRRAQSHQHGAIRAHAEQGGLSIRPIRAATLALLAEGAS